MNRYIYLAFICSFLSTSAFTQNNQPQSKVLQDTMYNVLEGITVTGKREQLWQVFKKVKENLHQNYLPSNIPLSYLHQCLIANEQDTLTSIQIPLTLYQPKAQVAKYYQYYDSQQVQLQIDTAIFAQYKSFWTFPFLFPNSFQQFVDYKYFRNIEKLAFVYIKVIEVENEPIMEVILVQKEPKPIDFGIFARPRQYPNQKYLESLVLLSAIKYQINMSNYAIQQFHKIEIPVEDSSFRNTFQNIRSSHEFDSYLSQLQQLRTPYYQWGFSFRRQSDQASQYILSQFFVHDNLLLKNYTLNHPPQYHFIQSWTFQSLQTDSTWSSRSQRIIHIQDAYPHLKKMQ